MIDVHLHLLPGVDDGPADLDASLDLARACVESGASVVVVTPHVNDQTSDVLPDAGIVRARVEALRKEIEHAGIPLTLHAGGESYLSPTLPADVRAGRVPTLAGTQWLLVETTLPYPPLFLDRTMFELQAAGIAPLLAHPERYAWLHKNPAALRRLAARGICAQVTAGALTGERGRTQRALAESFVREGLVQIIASDLHRAGGGATLRDAYAAAAALVGEERARDLVETNPQRILDGQPLVPHVEDPSFQPAPWWQKMWKRSANF